MPTNPYAIDPGARAGRTGYRLKVKDAKSHAQAARYELGNSRSDTPTVQDILAAAIHLSKLLHDATEGEAIVMAAVKTDDGKVDHVSPAVLRRMVA